MANQSQLEADCLATVTMHLKTHWLATENKTTYSPNKKYRSSKVIPFLYLVGSTFNFLFKAGGYLLMATFILYHCETTHEAISEQLSYISRIISLRFDLYKFPQLQDVHYKACFLFNPYYEVKDGDCKGCSNITEAVGITGLNESEFRKSYYLSGIPFLLKSSFQTPINLDSLRELLSKDLELKNYPTDKYSHIELPINPTNLSRILRKIFPAPDFLHPKAELYFQQIIYLDGTLASEYYLPIPYYGNVIVLQAKGRRMINLLPVWRCRSTCSSVSVVLEPGDTLYYDAYFWGASSQPILNNNENEDFSITNFGSFAQNRST